MANWSGLIISMANRTSIYHSRLKSDSACGRAGRQIQQWPRFIVSCFRPFPVWRQPDTFTLKNFDLLALLLALAQRISLISGNISCVAIKSKNPKFFHRVLKYNHRQIAQSITTHFLCSRLIVANVHKGAAKLSAAVEEGDSSEVVAEQETRGDPSFLPFPIWLASAFYI